MPDADAQTADPFEAATAAAVEDILAAMSATTHTDAPTGESVGHGTIRLRDPAAPAEPKARPDYPGSAAPAAPVAAPPDPAGAPADPALADPAGHGAIRLRG